MTPSRVRVAVLALAAAFAVAACGNAFQPPAAVVNGSRISQNELRENLPLFQFLVQVQQGQCGQPTAGEDAASACARYVLFNLIEEHIARPFAESHHVTVGTAAVDGALKYLEGLGPEVRALMQQGGLSASDLRPFLARLLLMQDVQRKVTEQSVSEADLMQLYSAHRLDYTRIHAAHILVKTRALAQRIASRATPRNFASLASKYSTDPGSKDKGGDLGTLTATQIGDPAFARAVLALKPGEISAPVHTRFGWHVIRLIGASVQPFRAVRDQLLAGLSRQAFGQWLHQRIASADIEINPRYGRLDVDGAAIVPVRSTETRTPASSSSPGATPLATATP